MDVENCVTDEVHIKSPALFALLQAIAELCHQLMDACRVQEREELQRLTEIWIEELMRG